MSRYLLFHELEKVPHFQPFSQYFPDFKLECWWEHKRIYLLGEEDFSYPFLYIWCDFSKQESANPLPTVTGTDFFFWQHFENPKVWKTWKQGLCALSCFLIVISFLALERARIKSVPLHLFTQIFRFSIHLTQSFLTTHFPLLGTMPTLKDFVELR